MHGKYQIIVVKPDGTQVDKFYAETHLVVGGTLVMPDGYEYNVIRVDHILKSDRNGGQPSYTAFAHVRLVVCNEEF